MCVVLANAARPVWKAPKSSTDDEVRAVFDGLVADCGTYETNEKKYYEMHHVEADREPELYERVIAETDLTHVA